MIKRNLLKHLVVEAVSSLPLRVREAMKNVVIVTEEEPRREASNEIGIERHEVLLGLYEGVPLVRRDSGYFGVLPDKITIFRKPIETLCGESEEKLTALVREVVWHEIGHHFGLSDPELYALEKKRPPKANLNASITKNIRIDKPIAVNQ
ncbi:MAG: metallopeptidase family protein [bacterium]|nr:metallopeptidase family protein [bacterium]